MRIWKWHGCSLKLRLFFIFLCAVSRLLWTAEKDQVTLMRTLKSDSARPVDLSADGRFLLTIGERKDADRKGRMLSVLAVYETDAGKLAGQPVIEPEAHFTAAVFDGAQHVLALKSHYKFPPALLEWDFHSGTLHERPAPYAREFLSACILNNHQITGVVYDPNRKIGFWPQNLAAVAGEDGLHMLRQPSPPPSRAPGFHTLYTLFGDNCHAWRSGNSLLLANANPGDLHWISLQPETDSTLCHSFSDEIICGQAVSPDGSLIAVVTTDSDLIKPGKIAEAPSVFLNVLEAQTCKPLRRLPLQFPEKSVWRRYAISSKKYLDNYMFLSQLASRMAISPDNAKLALAYGIYKSSDGIANFGLYSLADGRRLATLRGSVARGGLLSGLLSDEIWASSAPLAGMLRFSPDSRVLYAGSRGVFQWDISALK